MKGERVSSSANFRCPTCAARTKVTDTRWAPTKFTTRRRRECTNGHRFTTEEQPTQEYILDFQI